MDKILSKYKTDTRFTIKEILENTELTWTFIFGKSLKYAKGNYAEQCKSYNSSAQTIEQALKDKAMDSKALERQKKLAKLRNMVNKEPSFELDTEAVQTDMSKIQNALNVNIDFWAKNKYYISGIVKEDNEFVLEFTKEIADFKEKLIYNAEKEELYSEYIKGDYKTQKAVGASEIYLFGKFIEAINPSIVDFYNANLK